MKVPLKTNQIQISHSLVVLSQPQVAVTEMTEHVASMRIWLGKPKNQSAGEVKKRNRMRERVVVPCAGNCREKMQVSAPGECPESRSSCGKHA